MRSIRVITAAAASLAFLPAISPAQSPVPQLEGVIDLVIGGPDEERDAYLIHATSGLFLDPAGRIYVGERKGGTVRIFSPAGTLVTTFGRPGEGPGDLREPQAMAFDAKGLLWITDGQNRRYNAFDISGRAPKFVEALTVPANLGGPWLPAIWDDRGNVMHLSSRMSDSGSTTMRVFLARDGRVVRQELPPVVADPTPRKRLSKSTKDSRGFVGTVGVEIVQPFSGMAVHAYARNGEVAAAFTGKYEVRWYDPNLRHIRTVGRSIVPPKVSTQERDEREKQLADQAKNFGVSRSSLGLTIPASKAPMELLQFDLEGRLWVELSVSKGDPKTYDVYGRDGKHQATVRWPANVWPTEFVVRDSIVIGLALDEDNTPSVVRMKLRRVR